MAVVNEDMLQLAEEPCGQVAAWLVAFDQAWADGRLEAQVRDLPPPPDPRRRPALIELVKIDLERQWERGRRLLLEDYLHSYPELGTPASVAADLIQAEYEVRLQFGATADLADLDQR